MLEVIQEAKNFLFSYLQDKKIEYETLYPWSKDVNFIILHSLRVHQYALKIMQEEALTDEERIIIEVAALLHDIGRAGIIKGHAKVSADIVKEWITQSEAMSHIKDFNRLIRIIATHSNKEDDDADLCSNILKDADLLDEIGILSIFMHAHKLNPENPFIFNDLYTKIKTDELEFCFKTKKLLKTKTAQQILDEKIQFFNDFINHFETELKGTEEFYKDKLHNKNNLTF